MITAHVDAVPLDQVLPVLLKALPLKRDFEENGPVWKVILDLVIRGNQLVKRKDIWICFLPLHFTV